MAALAHNRSAACFFHDFNRVPDETRVIDDFSARIFVEERFCQEAYDIVAFNHIAVFIENEAAVKVAVERYAEVCFFFADNFCRSFTVFMQNRIWYAVREIAVRLIVNFNEVER